MVSEYILRIVVPFRDYKRIKPIIKRLKEKNVEPKFVHRDPIFPDRGDMDVVEYVYVIRMSEEERREMYNLLSRTLSGTIGFFLLYKYDKKGKFSKI